MEVFVTSACNWIRDKDYELLIPSSFALVISYVIKENKDSRNVKKWGYASFTTRKNQSSHIFKRACKNSSLQLDIVIVSRGMV